MRDTQDTKYGCVRDKDLQYERVRVTKKDPFSDEVVRRNGGEGLDPIGRVESLRSITGVCRGSNDTTLIRK